MGRHQVFGAQRQQVVDAGQQHPGVAVLLAPDGEDVEQHRPDQVVHSRPQLGEPIGDRIVGVGGGQGDMNGEAGHGDGGRGTERVRGRHEHRGEGGMGRVAVEVTQSHVHPAVRAGFGQVDGELLHQAPRIGR